MANQSTPTINHFVALVKISTLTNSLVFAEEIAQDIVNDLNLKVVKKISHAFFPEGFTLAYILSESHLLVHTWPEFGTIHLDLVTCSYRSEKEFENSVRSAFSAQTVEFIEIKTVNLDKPQILE